MADEQKLSRPAAPPVPREPTITVKTMNLSGDRREYFVSIVCEGREVTPHKFSEQWKAEYEAAFYRFVFGQGAEPDMLAYSEEGWPPAAPPAVPPQGDDKALVLVNLENRHGVDCPYWKTYGEECDCGLREEKSTPPASQVEALGSREPIKADGVNACSVCDCGSTEFRVGIESAPDTSNHIRLLECVHCQHQMRVPFQQGRAALRGRP